MCFISPLFQARLLSCDGGRVSIPSRFPCVSFYRCEGNRDCRACQGCSQCGRASNNITGGRNPTGISSERFLPDDYREQPVSSARVACVCPSRTVSPHWDALTARCHPSTTSPPPLRHRKHHTDRLPRRENRRSHKSRLYRTQTSGAENRWETTHTPPHPPVLKSQCP